MKVRCKGCGRVTKTDGSGRPTRCPGCGAELPAPASTPVSPGAAPNMAGRPGKGELPTEDKSTRNVGCLIMGVLLFGVPMFIGAITQGDEAGYWVLAIVALIALIPLGVWFERNTIKRRQR